MPKPGGAEVVVPLPDHFDQGNPPQELPVFPHRWTMPEIPQECPGPDALPLEIPLEEHPFSSPFPDGAEVISPHPKHFDFDRPLELPPQPDVWRRTEAPIECPFPADIPEEIPTEFPGKIEERPFQLPFPDTYPGPLELPDSDDQPQPGIVIFDWG